MAEHGRCSPSSGASSPIAGQGTLPTCRRGGPVRRQLPGAGAPRRPVGVPLGSPGWGAKAPRGGTCMGSLSGLPARLVAARGKRAREVCRGVARRRPAELVHQPRRAYWFDPGELARATSGSTRPSATSPTKRWCEANGEDWWSVGTGRGRRADPNIGKDIVYFHTLFCRDARGGVVRVPDRVRVHGASERHEDVQTAAPPSLPYLEHLVPTTCATTRQLSDWWMTSTFTPRTSSARTWNW